jgi:hypothetical protein
MGGLNFAALDAAQQQAEGYYPGSLAYTNSNPGNIVYGNFAQQYGATQGAGGFANFGTLANGTQAQDALITQYFQNNPNASISDLANYWAPPNATGNSPASTTQYANNMANILGVPATTPLSSLNTGGSSAISGISTGILNAISPGTVGANAVAGQTVQTNLSTWAQSGFSWMRVGTFLVGLFCLIVGIWFLKPVQQIVTNTTNKVSRAVKTGAAIAA